MINGLKIAGEDGGADTVCDKSRTNGLMGWEN